MQMADTTSARLEVDIVENNVSNGLPAVRYYCWHMPQGKYVLLP